MHVEGRRWVPERWCDEITPMPMANKNAFIFEREDGWVLDHPNEGEEVIEIAVKDGDVVELCANEQYGERILTVYPDKTFVKQGDWPDNANCFYLGDEWETLAHGIKTLIDDNWDDFFEEEIKQGRNQFSITVYWWSAPIKHRFIVENAKARLEEILGAALGESS